LLSAAIAGQGEFGLKAKGRTGGALKGRVTVCNAGQSGGVLAATDRLA